MSEQVVTNEGRSFQLYNALLYARHHLTVGETDTALAVVDDAISEARRQVRDEVEAETGEREGPSEVVYDHLVDDFSTV